MHVILLILIIKSVQADISNLCPFHYYISETYETFGAMKFKNDLSGNYNIQVNMTILLNTKKNIKITQRTPAWKIQNGEDLEYYVHFPYNHTFPTLTSVVFNGRIYCQQNEHYSRSPNQQYTHLTAFNFLQTEISEIVTRKLPVEVKMRYDYSECGKSEDSLPLVFSGRTIGNGEYPWMVAIFVTDNIATYKFRCAGNLISQRHVITAAHCLKPTEESTFNAEDITVVLGKSNLNRWVHNSTLRIASKIIIHPDYEEPADADIGVIVLEQPVEFKTTIRPVCLWDESDELENVVNTYGRLVGWGKDESQKPIVKMPKQIDLPIVSQYTCLQEDTRYYKLTSYRTFCSGYIEKNIGPCTGDSGSGFIILRGGVWKLRGITSVSLKDPITQGCDINKYTVFSDVAKHTTWIKSQMYSS